MWATLPFAMNKPTVLATLCLAALVGCGGGGGSTPDPAPNPPVGQIAFKNLSGNAPADLGLGRPLIVEWVMPAGFTPPSRARHHASASPPTPGVHAMPETIYDALHESHERQRSLCRRLR